LYIPYEVEKNPKDYENAPISMLNSEEKVRELNLIISDFEVNIIIFKKFLEILQLRKLLFIFYIFII